METSFNEMDSIFQRTKQALTEFTEIITPIINSSTDDHQRLYWHHIYEEEDHRSDRLNILMPKIKQVLENELNMADHQGEFLHLLQDISLEKFGLHNFLEHLDLSLFQFNGTEFEEKIRSLREFTYDDYQKMKEILNNLNQEFKGGIQFNTSIPTDEKEGTHENLKIAAYAHNDDHDHEHDHHGPTIQQQTPQKSRKTLTVGSLKQH